MDATMIKSIDAISRKKDTHLRFFLEKMNLISISLWSYPNHSRTEKNIRESSMTTYIYLAVVVRTKIHIPTISSVFSSHGFYVTERTAAAALDICNVRTVIIVLILLIKSMFDILWRSHNIVVYHVLIIRSIQARTRASVFVVARRMILIRRILSRGFVRSIWWWLLRGQLSLRRTRMHVASSVGSFRSVFYKHTRVVCGI
jgi:hypothetical protein